jgi:hypothetical protein
LQHGEIGGAVRAWHYDLVVDDRRTGGDVQCVVGDLPETLGPVVAAPGKDLHRFIDEMDLHPVAVELDFVKPSLAGRDPLDGSRERGFNEARKRGLRANGGRFSARSNQSPCRWGVGLDEVSDMFRHQVACDVATSLDHLRNILGNVVSPMLHRVEGHDANRVVKLACQKIIDDSFKVGPFDLGLAVDAAATEAINDQIDRLIRTVRHGARRPPRCGHGNPPTN